MRSLQSLAVPDCLFLAVLCEWSMYDTSFSEKMIVKSMMDSFKALDPSVGTLVSAVSGFVEQSAE